MALQFQVDDIATVPEALRGEYTEKDGKFHLNVDGAVPNAKLKEFRDTNIATRKELDALKAQFDGVDVETYRTLTEQAAKVRDKRLIDSGKVDELVAERVSAMKADNDKVLGTITKERDGLNGQLQGLLIDSALKDAAIKGGVTPAAVDDVLLRGRTVFKLHEGKATAFDGDKAIYGKDSEPLAMTEWVSGLAERAPHLFTVSSGGGSPKGGSQNQGGATTMTRAQYDALPQMERATAIKGKTLVD